jgi:hypothetical protein
MGMRGDNVEGYGFGIRGINQNKHTAWSKFIFLRGSKRVEKAYSQILGVNHVCAAAAACVTGKGLDILVPNQHDTTP